MSELQQLRDRVAELEEALGVTAALPTGFILKKPNGYRLRYADQLCGMLLERKIVTRTAAFEAIYGLRPYVDQPEMKIIDVLVCHLRACLKQHGIRIETVWGVGYRLTDDAKAKLRALFSPCCIEPECR